MEHAIDNRLISSFPALSEDELELEMFGATKGDPEVAAEWLGDLLRAGCTAEDQFPSGYLEDPFVLGFAFSFCGAFNRDFPRNKLDADFALEIFIALMGPEMGAELHSRALSLLSEAQIDFVRGAVNGERFHRAYGYPEACEDDPAFAVARQRAKDHMEKTRRHIPAGDMYEFVFAKYRNPACYDVYFMDVLRERFPEKVEWRQSALESLPNPDPDDVDWENLSGEELRAMLQEDGSPA
jgi:hypothetical protein